MSFASFFAEYKWTFLFYLAVILLIYLFRRKLDWPAKFVGLYRTKVGLKLMDRMGKHQRFFQLLGYIGVVVGFIGMLFILGMLGKGLYDLVFVPDAPPVISPVLPGITIPGVGVKVPLIIGWIALFVVVVVHEFSHGVVARAHKVPVKSSGLMLFGPLAGAFVEPEEKILKKKKKGVQLSIFAAGPFSNLLFSVFVWGVLSLILAPLLTGMIATNGIVFAEVQEGYPAMQSGVMPGVVYDQVNGKYVKDTDDFLTALQDIKPGDDVTLSSSSTQSIQKFTAVENPEKPEKGYIGVILGHNLKHPEQAWLFSTLTWITTLCTWVLLLGLGIGLANLLPIGPVDGGRMFQVASLSIFGKKRGHTVWARASIVIVAIILVLLFVPIIRSFF